MLVFSPQTLIDNVHLGTAPTWGNFFVAIPLCMLAYTGIETISNMSEEAKDPGRTVPKAINRVVIAVFAIYALLPAIALSALPVRCVGSHCQTLLGVDDQHGGYAGDPVLGVVRALHLGPLQHAAEVYVGLLAATILFIATNAGILGVSRLTYSMGIHRQVPDRLRRLHPKFGTPWVGIIIFSTIAAITLIPGQADVPRQPVRVRRDAVVHDRAPGGDAHADHAAQRRRARTGRPGNLRLSRSATCRCSRSSAASARSRRCWCWPRCTRAWRSPGSAGCRSG